MQNVTIFRINIDMTIVYIFLKCAITSIFLFIFAF